MPSVSRPSSKVEVVIGRSLAACVHPEAAWRTGMKGRLPVVVGYFFISYLLILVSLSLTPLS
jgi:hypothetical protein